MPDQQKDQKIRSITIDFVPQDKMRYDTCGDWLFDGFGNLHIVVAEQGVLLYNVPIAIHELIEAVLCKIRDVTQEQVDAYDMSYSGPPDEPGENPNAPYFEQHRLASDVECFLIDELDACGYIEAEDYWKTT